MDWLSQNWFFALVLVAFVALHLFGHGSHAGHAGHGARDRTAADGDDPQGDRPAPHRHEHPDGP